MPYLTAGSLGLMYHCFAWIALAKIKSFENLSGPQGTQELIVVHSNMLIFALNSFLT